MRKVINKIMQIRHGVLEIVELILAIVVFVVVLYFGFNMAKGFILIDWSAASSLYEFISFVLLILLGLEVSRLIAVHNITVVMEIMLLIIARKMLYPDISALDLLFSTIAFALVVGVYYLYKIKPIKSLDDLTK